MSVELHNNKCVKVLTIWHLFFEASRRIWALSIINNEQSSLKLFSTYASCTQIYEWIFFSWTPFTAITCSLKHKHIEVSAQTGHLIIVSHVYSQASKAFGSLIILKLDRWKWDTVNVVVNQCLMQSKAVSQESHHTGTAMLTQQNRNMCN